MSCSHEIWDQCLNYGCYQVGPTLKTRVLPFHSGMWTLKDWSPEQVHIGHATPMQTPANSCAAPFLTGTELKCFQILFLPLAKEKIYRWSKRRFRPQKTQLKSKPKTQISSKGAITVFRESINEISAHKR